MTEGVHIEHLIPHLVKALDLGFPDRRHWAATYGLTSDQVNTLFDAAHAVRDHARAEIEALRSPVEADGEAA